MTDADFKGRVVAALTKVGATDIVATAGKKLLGARCKLKGVEFEMSIVRGKYDERSKASIIDAIAHLPAQAAAPR